MESKRILSLVLVICLCLSMIPVVTMQAEATGYYDDSALSNIKCSILSNTARANYVNAMMKYHIQSSTDDYRVARNLENGSSVVFFFDGCSDNMDSPTYSNYNKYRLSAYCAVVQKVNGVLKVVYESENCSTIPDNPRTVSLNGNTPVPTVLDGVYNIISTNHLSRYAALNVADNSGSAPVIRCTSSSSYISTSTGINIHARSNFSSAPTNGISSTSYSSTGCFIVGLTNNTWSEYNDFIYSVLGISNAIKTTPYSSGSWTKCTAGRDNGIVVLDRSQYKTQLAAIYGGDNNHSANALVSKITAYTDNLDYEAHTTHSYSGSYYEDAHPHKVYQMCSCGATQYTGATTTVSSCGICNPVGVSSKYNAVLPFKAYLKDTATVYPYSSEQLATQTGGEIWSTDECTITAVYSNGACQVTYPVGSSTKTAYTSLSCFVDDSAAALIEQTVDRQTTTYIRAGTDSTSYGYVDAGDLIYKLGSSGSLTQIFYPDSGGYTLAWVQTSELVAPAYDDRFAPYCPINGYPCTGYDFDVYASNHSTNYGQISSNDYSVDASDYCTINAVYADGWCQVSYPTDSGTNTAYAPLSRFVYNTSFSHVNYTANAQITVYATKALSIDSGWDISVGDVFYVVGTYGSGSQVLYPVDAQNGGGYNLGWIRTDSLPKTTYTVSYDANGGSNTPKAQVKIQGSSLNLSAAVPVRENYSFLGWATEENPTVVQYQPGDTYSADSDILLVAVWKCDLNPTITAGTVFGKPGDTVVVPISIYENPGIIAALLKIAYDGDVLTLTNVEDGGILGEHRFSDTLTANPYVVSWSNGAAENDFTATGVLVYLTFTISENADTGEFPITISCDPEEIYNNNQEQVSVEMQQGMVKVEKAKPVLTLNYPSLSFEDEILYNVYYGIDDTSGVVEMGLITFSEKLTDGTITDAVDVIPGYVSSGATYMAQTKGIPAKNLCDALYFKVYAKLSDGSYVYSDVAGYNAVAYAKTVLSSSTSTQEAKALMVAMLNYGAAAQEFFGYKTDSLMNAFLSDAGKALAAPYDESMVDPVVQADSTRGGHFVMNKTAFTNIYPTVSFEGAFTINYYVVNGLTPDSGITFCYWDAATYESADKLTTANATGILKMEQDGDRWYASVDGIAAKDMDKTIYVAAIYKSGGTAYTTSVIAYSLGKYCQTIAARGDAFGAATAVYGYYAKAYFD